MRFSHQDIDAARRLRELGLSWFPAPGHFVFDEAGVIEQPSPFQDRVYFILELKHFIRRTGGLDGLQSVLFWLPTWHDARELLKSQGVAGGEVADALKNAGAIESRSELLTLYSLIAVGLQRDLNSRDIKHREQVPK